MFKLNRAGTCCTTYAGLAYRPGRRGDHATFPRPDHFRELRGGLYPTHREKETSPLTYLGDSQPRNVTHACSICTFATAAS